MIKLIDILFENVGCCSRPKAPLLLENDGKTLISEHLQYHIQNKLPLTENTFRYGSKSFLDLWNEARDLHNNGIIKLDGDDRAIIEETDLGHFGMFEGKKVPLDFPIELTEAEKLTYNDFVQMVRDDMMAGASPDEKPSEEQVKKKAKAYYNDYLQGTSVDDLFEAKKKKKKDPPLNKPKRGGSKAYYVYVRDPKTKKIKKVSFGSGGLKAKINNKEARQAFAKRHRCSEKKDRTSPGYWSCNLPKYAKQLGINSTFSGYW